MHNQNRVQLTINPTDQVQLTIEVQVQELHPVRIVRLRQDQATTVVPLLAVAAAEVTTVVEAAGAAAVHTLPGVRAVRVQEEVQAGAADVHQVGVHHLQAVVNFGKQLRNCGSTKMP